MTCREIPENEPSINGLEEIADHYGFGAQSNQLIEECAELIQAVNKYKRAITKCGQPLEDYNSTIVLDNLVEEIADVEVMLEQIKYLLGINEEDIRELKKFKINRTLGKMGRR